MKSKINKFDQQYVEILKEIMYEGSLEKNRTGIRAYTIPSTQIKHNMKDGFPLLTLRKIPYKSVKVELEGFLKGINKKSWYKDRGCKYWNEWCSPKKVPYANDPDTKRRMESEDDLGIIYGTNWREFGAPVDTWDGEYIIQDSVDQLKNIVDKLRFDPTDRRMLCTSWNPLALEYAALPACHVLWRVMVINNKLHLSWYQRSTDFVLGLPSNMASYATLLHLLSYQSGFEAGTITGHLDCVHVYENHIENMKLMLDDCNLTTEMPTLETPYFKDIYQWTYRDTELKNYHPQMSMKFEVAV